MSSKNLNLTRQQEQVLRNQIGPQVVGGTYHCGYWGESYRVDTINIGETSGMARFGVTWLKDGRTTSHLTAWNPKRDRVLTQPWWVLIEREHSRDIAVGPFISEAEADGALVGRGPNGLLVDGLCEEDALDASTTQAVDVVAHEFVIVP